MNPPAANSPARFKGTVLPLLDGAFNLARWLLRDDMAAEDAVQEAAMSAQRYFHTFRGGDARPWFLAIVRNACYAQMKAAASRQEVAGLDDEAMTALQDPEVGWQADPARQLARRQSMNQVDLALSQLPAEQREVIVLRELEDLSYAEIALVIAAPVGTVMSRLGRARAQLRRDLSALRSTGGAHDE